MKGPALFVFGLVFVKDKMLRLPHCQIPPHKYLQAVPLCRMKSLPPLLTHGFWNNSVKVGILSTEPSLELNNKVFFCQSVTSSVNSCYLVSISNQWKIKFSIGSQLSTDSKRLHSKGRGWWRCWRMWWDWAWLRADDCQAAYQAAAPTRPPVSYFKEELISAPFSMLPFLVNSSVSLLKRDLMYLS